MTLLMLGLSFGLLSGQQKERPAYREMMEAANLANFYEIQEAAEKYFQDHGTGRETGWKQYKRWEWFMEPRVYPSGEMMSPRLRAFEAFQEKKVPLHQQEKVASPHGNWNSLGPDDWIPGPSGNTGGMGRLNAMAFDPSDVNTMYVGAPDGGVWKTTDNGSSWFSISDDLSQLGVSDIAIDPNNSDNIYILTGDGPGAASANWPSIHNVGVMKTTNGGNTWGATDLTFTAPNDSRGYRLVMSPGNSSILIAATNSGLHRTTNGGKTSDNEHFLWNDAIILTKGALKTEFKVQFMCERRGVPGRTILPAVTENQWLKKQVAMKMPP